MAGRDDELAIVRLAWRIDALDKWRSELEHDRERFRAEIEGKLVELRTELDGLTKAQEIAKAVSAELRKERGGGEVATKLPFPAKLGAFAAGALVVADAIRGLIS